MCNVAVTLGGECRSGSCRERVGYHESGVVPCAGIFGTDVAETDYEVFHLYCGIVVVELCI